MVGLNDGECFARWHQVKRVWALGHTDVAASCFGSPAYGLTAPADAGFPPVRR